MAGNYKECQYKFLKRNVQHLHDYSVVSFIATVKYHDQYIPSFNRASYRQHWRHKPATPIFMVVHHGDVTWAPLRLNLVAIRLHVQQLGRAPNTGKYQRSASVAFTGRWLVMRKAYTCHNVFMCTFDCYWNCTDIPIASRNMRTRRLFLYKTLSYQFRNSHYKDKTISCPSYLYNHDGNLHTR